jgi:hypothetical protein
MFAPRYFAPRHFAPRYFPPGFAIEVVETFQGGARERKEEYPRKIETIGERFRRLRAERLEAEAQLEAKAEQVREFAKQAKKAEKPRPVSELFPQELERELIARLQQIEITERLEDLKQAEKKAQEQEMLMLMVMLIDE